VSTFPAESQLRFGHLEGNDRERNAEQLKRKLGPSDGFSARRFDPIVALAASAAPRSWLAQRARDHALLLEANERTVDRWNASLAAGAFLDAMHDRDAVCVARLLQQYREKLKL
jgi:hypothetical protein